MERAVNFRSGPNTLRGILHTPETGAVIPGPGVIFLHGWSGCRLGPHRMFVKTARRLSERGCACLRFDFAGRGESDGDTGRATIRTMIRDAETAVRAFPGMAPCSGLALLGICSGTKVAIGTAGSAAGIDGVALWAPEAMGYLRSRSARARRILRMLKVYASALRTGRTWRKIATFRVNTRLVGRAVVGSEWADRDEMADESSMLDAFRRYAGRALLIGGGGDSETVRAGAAYGRFCESSRIGCEYHVIPHANHSFYSLDWENEVIGLTERWITGIHAG